MVTFLHAADIHLDSPLANLRLGDDLGSGIFRGVTRRALDNLVELALREKVDFLLLAGDLYDGPWRDFNTGLFFIDRMQRLHKAGIKVFLVAGNHDAASRITRALRLPDNVTFFPSAHAHTEILDELGVAIHGRSYGRRAEIDNLAAEYPDPVPGLFNIGILHTALTGREGHAPYAPCTLTELCGRGYDYWALGHVHQHEILHRDPWVVFAGNLQGRHIRETGPRGCCLIRAEAGRIGEVSFVPLDVIRWQRIEVDCTGLASGDDLRALARSSLEEAWGASDGRPLVVRIVLSGPCPLHMALVREQAFWESELSGLGLAIGDIYLEGVEIRTRPAATEELSDLGCTLLQETPEQLDADLVEELFAAAQLKTLERALPASISRTDLLPHEEDERHALLAEARDMVLAHLRGGVTPTPGGRDNEK